MTGLRIPMAALALATVVGLAACAAQDAATTTPSPSAPAPQLGGTSWVLTAYAGPSGPVAAQEGASAPLAFGSDGSVTGSTGCNRFTGTFDQQGSSVTIAVGAMTRAACGTQELTDQEQAVVSSLEQVRAFAISADGSLALRDQGGTDVLTYGPGLTELPGTSWTATGINNGRDAVVGTDATSAVTATFGPDTVRGTTGCNTYRAEVTYADESGLTIGPISVTEKECAKPVMGTESEYLEALGKVTAYQIDGDSLTLRDAQGATQVTFARG